MCLTEAVLDDNNEKIASPIIRCVYLVLHSILSDMLELFWIVFKPYRRPGQHLTPQLPLADYVLLRYFSVKVGFFFLNHFQAGQRLQDLSLPF